MKMTELQNLTEGFQILQNLGASGVIAQHDLLIVVGARYDVPHETRDKLNSLGFKPCEDHKWMVSV